MGPVVAAAGRRIDAPDAPTRFPLERSPKVKEKLKQALVQHLASALVCSAACGSDLLALEAAGELGLRRRIVLPFDAERFRETSVTDRPGEWGDRYDRAIAEVSEAGDLVVLRAVPEDVSPWSAATDAIIEEAVSLAQPPARTLAVQVWEGRSRGEGDETERFGELARRHGIPLIEILTIEER